MAIVSGTVFDGLTDVITRIVETLGAVGVALLVAVENVFPPIPSELVLPLAGFVAGRGDASLTAMLIGATTGSVVGAWILYGIAAWIGHDRLHRLVRRHGRWFGVRIADLERAEAWFDRRAASTVLVGRCVPLIRSLISVPAGFRRMPLGRFTVYTAIGSTIWNGALIGAGAVLGDQWERVGGVIERFQWVVVACIALGAAVFAWKRILSPRLRRTPGC